MITSGLPVVTGSVLITIHAEISELMRELQESRLTTSALDRICVTRPELRGELVAEMQRIIDEQKNGAAKAPPKKGKRR